MAGTLPRDNKLTSTVSESSPSRSTLLNTTVAGTCQFSRWLCGFQAYMVAATSQLTHSLGRPQPDLSADPPVIPLFHYCPQFLCDFHSCIPLQSVQVCPFLSSSGHA